MRDFDLIIIGGGITGAGIFREAAALGISVLLVEAGDFASKTSSASSKLVHGGLRYLKQGALHLTLDSVKHRERLLKEMKGMVKPLPFLMPLYKDNGPSKLQMKAGLCLYDLMAGKKDHRFKDPCKLSLSIPEIRRDKLKGAFIFKDAQVDDAGLVLRLIKEGEKNKKALALNYTRVESLIVKNKEVRGVRTKNSIGEKKDFSSKLVINAGGVLTDRLHPLPEKKQRIRALRGSHLIFPSNMVKLKSALSFLHPEDKRPVFFLPWKNRLILGTTDLDASIREGCKARISEEEISYLLKAAAYIFPEAAFTRKSIVSTFSGLRPVISSDTEKAPSEESREYKIWKKAGIISVTGGKLTNFRKIAWDVLKKASEDISIKNIDKNSPLIPPNPYPCPDFISREKWQALYCRYGDLLEEKSIFKEELKEKIGDTPYHYFELLLGAREKVFYLDDLLLRRLRLGLLLEDGGFKLMEKIKDISLSSLGWSEEKWKVEIRNYKNLWDSRHGIKK